ncbi:MAG: hypothetical protein E5299_00631 [Burkholderia gladioli]|nr:MAG: hypothetical protein E5299_00631 [Burkholderia gladioli]
MRLITPPRTATSVACGSHVMCPEQVAGERLEPIHRILGKRSPVIATVFLPFSTTVTGNCINRAGTLRRTGRIRWPMSGTLAWRNQRSSTACSNGRMAWLGVVGTVTADGIDLLFAWNLVEQLGQRGALLHKSSVSLHEPTLLVDAQQPYLNHVKTAHHTPPSLSI